MRVLTFDDVSKLRWPGLVRARWWWTQQLVRQVGTFKPINRRLQVCLDDNQPDKVSPLASTCQLVRLARLTKSRSIFFFLSINTRSSRLVESSLILKSCCERRSSGLGAGWAGWEGPGGAGPGAGAEAEAEPGPGAGVGAAEIEGDREGGAEV